MQKKLGSSDDINWLQLVDFRYNIRGQLVNINNSTLTHDGGQTDDDPDSGASVWRRAVRLCTRAPLIGRLMLCMLIYKVLQRTFEHVDTMTGIVCYSIGVLWTCQRGTSAPPFLAFALHTRLNERL